MVEFFLKKKRVKLFFVAVGITLFFISLCLVKEKKKILFIEQQIENSSSKKEFRLFDSYVSKEERELQLAEIAALKAQIEQDLQLFPRIKEARIVLDFHPRKTEQKVKKASVILSIEEQVILTESELLAICYHLSSAIEDLDIKQIAITDTQGRLYKKQDSDTFILYATSPKDNLANRVQIMLEKVMGKEYFSFCIQESPLSVHFLFDERFFKQKQFIPHLLKQIEAVDQKIVVSIEWTHFVGKSDFSKFYWAAAIFFLIFFGGIYGIKRTKEQKIKGSDQRLAEMIKDQPPKILAIMLSYLDPIKAKKVLEALPIATQEAIANYHTERQ